MTKEVLIVVRKLTDRIEVEEFKLRELSITIETLKNKVKSNSDDQVQKLSEKQVEELEFLKQLQEINHACKLELWQIFHNAIRKKIVRKVFELRYISCLPYKNIARKLGYTEGSIYRFHKIGLIDLGLKKTDSKMTVDTKAPA